MKRIIILGFILLSVCFFIFPEENNNNLKFWFTDNISCYYYIESLEKFKETKITVYYKKDYEYTVIEKINKWKSQEVTKKDNIIQLYFNASITRNCLEILPENRIKILEIIKKYKEWNDKATKEKVTLSKMIDNITYNLSWCSIYGDDWYHSQNNKMYFSFFSQNNKTHQLVISFNKGKDINNSYIDNTPEAIVFNYDGVLILEKYLSDDYIKNQIKIALKEKEKEDMFK
jgi:hypothetical protein